MDSLKIDSTTKYLTLSDLPHNCIFNKVVTGCGGTTIALFNEENYVIAVPTTELIINKTGLTSANIATITSPEGKEMKVFGLFGTLMYGDNQLLMDYLSRDGAKKILCTYDKLPKLTELLDPQDYRLLVDEYHTLLKAYCYRKKAIDGVLDNFKRYKSFCFMSATPINAEIKPDALADVEEVTAKWEGQSSVEGILLPTRNPYSTVANIIEKYQMDGFIKVADSKSYEAFFFINSVSDIAAILRLCHIRKNEVKIVCANSEANRDKLAGYEIGNSRSPKKKFTFITSKSFEGADYDSATGICFVVSNTSNINTLLDIGTDIYQIAGRIRTESNPFKNMVFHVYNTQDQQYYYSDVQEKTYGEMVAITKKKLDDENKILEYAKFLDVPNETIEDFLNNDHIIKDSDGNYVINDLPEKLKLYIFRVEQSIYKNKYSILDSYDQSGVLTTETPNYGKISGSMRTAMRKMGFKDAFKKYIELINTPNAGNDLQQLVANHPFVKEAFEKLGEQEIRHLRYVEKRIKEAIKNRDIISAQYYDVAMRLKDTLTEDEYSAKALEQEIQTAYDAVGLQRKAKGSDVIKFFECKHTSKRIDGKPCWIYEILGLKAMYKNKI